ncbi:ATP-binding protein [Streptomyces sp. NPDC051561]|uniref:ATP-binding protein n=1 Tax=Streptomyces sp. NPDC051561 TaxID=3365658 RepID=UPI003796FE18
MGIDLVLLPSVAFRGQEVTAPRLRGLLALLAGEVRTGCSTERLVAGLWADGELPERPGKAVQVLVSRVRAQVGADVVVSTPRGYRLGLREDQVDSSVLRAHAALSAERAGAGDHAGALAAAEAGLALWEGASDGRAASADGPVAELRAGCALVRDALVRARALALARSGRHAQAVGSLAAVAAERPRDEAVLAELLRAEAATVGAPAALTRFEAYRRALREELGTGPGAALGAVQQELLRAAAPLVRHGVAHEPNPLLGRARDVAAVSGLLRESRVVGVVGPGGLGKTRLAHAVGRAAEQRVVYFVPLAGVSADTEVAAQVAAVLGAVEGRHGTAGGRAPADPVAEILGVLGAGPVLLVLDNCEQVARGAAALVRRLVASSPGLRVLVTGRASLGLTSEVVYALPKLVPEVAAELFVQRARAVRPGVEPARDAVAEVCRHLDGLPLAVELAAARVRVLSVPEIARRLGDRFALLRGGARDAPERHRTLYAVVEWSWNLLAEEARAAMWMLSVFPGGFSVGTAEWVLGGAALDLLEELAGQSLLTVVDTPAGVRFRMLETVREFSAARRAEAGQEDEAVVRLLRWATNFGVSQHDVLFGPEPLAGWERIRAEQDNLVAALRLALTRSDGPAIAAITAVLAALFATDSNYPRLGALAADTGPPLSHYYPEPAYVEVARAAAVLCTPSLFMGYGPHVVRQLVVLRRLPPASPDTPLRAVAAVLGAVPEMLPPSYDVLLKLCGSDRPLVAGIAECVATYFWEYEHDVGRALASAHRMVTALARVDTPSVQVMAYSRLSELCLRSGEGDTAYRALRAALDALPRLGDADDYIGIRWGLALACLQRAEPDEAEYWQRQAEGAGDPQRDAFYSPDLGVRAEIALARGLTEAGLALWRGAVARLPEAAAARVDDFWLDPWALEIQSAAVTAHAYAGRSDLVEELIGLLRQRQRRLLDGPPGTPLELPACGTVLLALGVAGLVAGDTGAVREVALAGRTGVLGEFRPTMSVERARRAAEEAAGAAYREAVSRYAALGRDELREAHRALSSDRG